MTPPLWTLSRIHCCLSIVSEANSYINASLLHQFHSIIVFATKGIGRGIMTHFWTTPLFISRAHQRRDCCIVFYFLSLFPSPFPLFKSLLSSASMCTQDPYVHTGNIGRKLGQESKDWNSLWSSNLLDTLSTIFSLREGKKWGLCKKDLPNLMLKWI